MNLKPALLFLIAVSAFAAKPGSYPAHLASDSGGRIIIAGIQALGGWDNWKSKKNVQYQRDGTRYEDGGKVVKEVQLHQMTLPPEVKVRQETLRDGKRIVTSFDGSSAWVTEDGKPVSDEKRVVGARGSSFGTQYMFCVPFKLADEGTVHEYLGAVQLGANSFDKVKVTYKTGTGDNPTHVWTYYFNRKTHFLERLDWSNAENTSHSVSEYSDFRKIDGLWWPMRRTNFMADAKGEKGRKTSELVYKNVRFNIDFPPSTFVKPFPPRIFTKPM